MRIYPLNERTLVVELGTHLSVSINRQALSLQTRLEERSVHGVLECWPTYASLGISFDPLLISVDALEEEVRSALSRVDEDWDQSHTTVTIPVHYHNTQQEDMRSITEALGLSATEIASIHASATYIVSMLGFLPGFPYLIGLPSVLHHPRKTQPSLRLPKGAVAIGGAQTGIYPHAGPGGWHVIGHTDRKLFTPPGTFLLRAGDEVKFEPV
ncbi:MAG: 5-oxoprolinase subunit PxpB [Bacteroidota bacterium]